MVNYYNSDLHARHKLLLSLLGGILTFVFSFYGYQIDLSGLRIDIPWSLIFSLLPALAFGYKYGIASGLSGGALYPFVLWSNNGYANAMNMMLLLLFFTLAGIAAGFKGNGNFKIQLLRLFLLFVFFTAVISFSYLVLFNILLSLNPPFWMNDTITSLDIKILQGFVLKDLANIAFMGAFSELLLKLPAVRILFGLKTLSRMKHNHRIFLFTLLAAVIIGFVEIILNKFLFGISPAEEPHIKLSLLVLFWSTIPVARIIIYYTEQSILEKEKTGELNKNFETLIEAIPDAIFFKDGSGRWKITNKTAQALFKLEGYDWYEKTDLEMADERPELKNAYLECKKSDDEAWLKGGVFSLLEYISDERGDHVFDVRKVPIYNSESDKNGLLIIGTEITEKIKNEEILKQNRFILEQSQGIAKVGSWVIDYPTGNLYWSKETFNIFGLSPENFSPSYNGFLNAVHTEDRDFVNSAYINSLKSAGSEYEIEHRIIMPENSEIKHVLEKCIHQRDDNGRVVKSYGIVQDITERKNYEANLKAIIENTLVNIWSIDNNYIIQYVNTVFSSAYDNIFGIYLKPGINVLEPLPVELRDEWKEQYDRALAGEQFTFVKSIKINSMTIFVEVSMNPIKVGGHVTGVSCYGKDITENKMAEDKLIKSEEKFSKIGNSALDAIIMINEEGNVEYWNPAAEEIFGYTFAEAAGRPVHSLIMPEKYSQQQRNGWSRFRETGEGKALGNVLNLDAVNKRGESLPVEIALAPIKMNNKYWGLAYIRDISLRRKNEIELEKYRNHLEELVKERTSEIGHVNSLLIKEIELKTEAEKKLQDSLGREKELNNLKSRFISTASHEFKTPLTAILSSSELIQRYRKAWDDSKIDLHLDRIKNSVSYLAKLTDDVLLVNRIEAGKVPFNPSVCNLRILCDRIIEDIHAHTTDKHTFIYNTEIKEENVYIDAKQIELILHNLLSNAFKYSPDGGRVELTLNQEGKKLFFAVKDSGIGIPAKDLPHLFETFHRSENTKDIKGTGLGLSIVKHAIELHGGTIEVDSVEGKGTEFRVTIPLSK